MIQSAQQVAPRQDDPPYRPGEPVALFIPCYIDQFYPSIGQACTKLLEKFGVPMVFPDRQTCCGQPAFNSGYWDEARPVIQHFCKTFADQRWIVCPSASCTAMARVFFGHVDPSDEVVGVGRRVFELTEFLVDVLDVTDTGATFPHKVTMHSGCHGRRELGIVEQPLTLLKNVRGLTYERVAEHRGVLRLRRHVQRENARHVAGDGQDQSREHREDRGGVRRLDRYQLPDARRRHSATNPEAKHIKPIHIAEVLAAGWERRSRRTKSRMTNGMRMPKCKQNGNCRLDMSCISRFFRHSRFRHYRPVLRASVLKSLPNQLSISCSTSSHLEGAEFWPEETKGLAEPSAPKSLGVSAEKSSKDNRAVTDAVPYFQDWREAAHRIKTYAIANLDKLLVEFERNITARGATVLWAKDAAEANQLRARHRPANTTSKAW